MHHKSPKNHGFCNAAKIPHSFRVKPLAASGISRLLEKYFGSYKFSEEQIESLTRYKLVTPGDFSQLFGKIRFMEKDEIASELIIQELKGIQNEKNGMNLSRIGFCA